MSSDDIPIDIHYNKLQDWLISRRHCQHQWQASVLVIREKINVAIQDMPPVEEITQLLHGTYINYFHCKKIVELLKDTEASTKNIFGRYSSQRMKDWQEIVNLYEKDNVYLAEVAQLLTRNVNYEVPSLKKQIARSQQIQADCTRKEGEHAGSSADFNQKFKQKCKQLGIEGKKIKSELVELVKDLPSTFDKVARDAQALTPGVDYYTAFVGFLTQKSEHGDERVPLAKHVIAKGNTTTYEWKNGEAPTRVEETLLDFHIEEDKADDAEEGGEDIDWGNIEAAGDGIDFGAEGTEAIDFGDQPETEDAGIDWDGDAAHVEIEVLGDSTATVESSDGVARGDDALTILDCTETRNLFINELLELEAFLTQRHLELQVTSSVISSSQLQSAPSALQLDAQQVHGMLQEVQRILGQLSARKMQDFFLIRSSPRYVDRLADSVRKFSEDSEKMMSLSRLMVTRRNEALEEQRSVEPKLDLIRTRTKELQKQIEQEISKKYQNRRVNIMGEINLI